MNQFNKYDFFFYWHHIKLNKRVFAVVNFLFILSDADNRLSRRLGVKPLCESE